MQCTEVSSRGFAASSYLSTTLTAGDDAIFNFHAPEVIRDNTETKQLQIIEPVSLSDFISLELSQVKEVEAVLTARQENLFYLWIIVDPFHRAIREKIYARERGIINEFMRFDFDFNIVSRRGRNLNELISDPMMKLTFRREPSAA